MRVWLKDCRIQQGFTQEEVARLAKISRSYYTHIEKKSKTPSVAVAKNIGKVLAFNWVKFFDEEKEPVDD